MTPKFVHKGWFVFIISILLLTDLAILLNIPFLRQILGFLFLTILPGLLLLQILKLNKIGYTEKFVLTWGVSISFLMFFGLLVNNLLLYFGYETPLATIPLLIFFNLAFVVLAIKTFGKSFIKTSNLEEVGSIGMKSWLQDLDLSISEKAFLIVPILFPALSIFGMHVMNTTDNNIILMFMLFLIPAYVIFVCLFNRKFPKRLYPVVIFLISISLLLLMALRSNHLIGIDSHVEYYYFRTTLDNLHWSILGHSTLDACLAISLLPTIYQSILNISPEFLFKILYSLLFSIAPLVIYVLSKRYVGDFYGFLTSCFFMSLHNFLLTPLHARTNTAVLFFALAMMVLFSDKIDPLKKRILFIVFMASCMVSHYSSTYIFFFIMFGTLIELEILSKKYTVKKVVSLTIMILFFVLIFFWYSQVTEEAFNAGVSFIETTFTDLNRFFVEEMRSESVRTVFGEGMIEKGITHQIHFLLTWITFAFIGIGVVTLIKRYKEMSFPELNFTKADFLKDKFEVGYFVAALICSGLLVAVIAVPFVSVGYGIDRVYLLGITILAVFFVIGGIILSRRLKVRAYLIILLVLIPYFLCFTGVMYNIFGVPQAITLNSGGEQYDVYYIHDQESYCAKWLKSNTDEKAIIYGDSWSNLRLISQGMIHSPIYAKSLIEDKKAIKSGYIYLRYTGVVDGKLADTGSKWHNITEYEGKFGNNNKIYNNGGSEVWK